MVQLGALSRPTWSNSALLVAYTGRTAYFLNLVQLHVFGPTFVLCGVRRSIGICDFLTCLKPSVRPQYAAVLLKNKILHGVLRTPIPRTFTQPITHISSYVRRTLGVRIILLQVLSTSKLHSELTPMYKFHRRTQGVRLLQPI